jgi:hypothetical protein
VVSERGGIAVQNGSRRAMCKHCASCSIFLTSCRSRHMAKSVFSNARRDSRRTSCEQSCIIDLQGRHMPAVGAAERRCVRQQRKQSYIGKERTNTVNISADIVDWTIFGWLVFPEYLTIVEQSRLCSSTLLDTRFLLCSLSVPSCDGCIPPPDPARREEPL